MERPKNVDFVLKDIRSNILDSYVNSLENRIDKAIETLKDTSVDMPSTLLMDTIGYAIYILEGSDKE